MPTIRVKFPTDHPHYSWQVIVGLAQHLNLSITELVRQAIEEYPFDGNQDEYGFVPHKHMTGPLVVMELSQTELASLERIKWELKTEDTGVAVQIALADLKLKTLPPPLDDDGDDGDVGEARSLPWPPPGAVILDNWP